MKFYSRGFTLVELIVVITILAILATIGFVSFLGYQLTARDAIRISDIQNLSKLIELYKLENDTYPPVTNLINVSFSGSTIWKQGSFGDESRQFARRISQVPVDPLTGNQYAYAITQATGEYQVGAIVEKPSTIAQSFIPQTHAASVLQVFASTMIKGNYNGKFIAHRDNDNMYILGVPSILSNEITDVTLQEIHTNNSFVYEGQSAAPATYSGSLAGEMDWNLAPTNTSGDITVIYSGSLNEINTGSGKIDLISNLRNYYQNTDVAGSLDYQILSQIDPASSPDEAIELVNTYISTGVGGLGNGALLLTEISSSESGGGSPATVYAYCGTSYNASYNNYGGFYNAYGYPNSGAHVAMRADGSIDSWGNAGDGGIGEPSGTGFTKISSTFEAFAALTSDGSVEAWGNNSFGGDDSDAPGGPGYTDIYATRTAFAALHGDGSIEVWGWALYGGDPSTKPTGTGFIHIASNYGAFAALHEDGSIETWGNASYGSTGAPAGTGYRKIYSTERAFAALHEDGSITTWGDAGYGGTGAPAGTSYVKIFSNTQAFAALTSDGSIDVWGNATRGGDDADAPSGAGYTNIFSTQRAFAALTSDGSIDTWGDNLYGGDDTQAPAGNGYTSIQATGSAFAAIAPDGSIDAWGTAASGGAGAPSGTDYIKIFSNLRAFAALTSDGSVDAWGYNDWGGNDISAPSGAGYTDISSNTASFAAIASDGSVDTWGRAGEGGAQIPAGTGFVSMNGGNVCQ